MIEAEMRAGPATLQACRFDPPGASIYLLKIHGIRIAPATLNKLRSIGGGAEFQKFGRSVYYVQAALDDWALAKLGPMRRTTSDAA